MKTQEPEQSAPDERSIEAAAAAAVADLQLQVKVKSVTADGDRWCIQFTADYSQYSDSFRDRFGRANSFELIREKVKRHILKQQQNKIRANVRIRRGRPVSPPADSLLTTALKTIETVAVQAADVAGEIIAEAASLPAKALQAAEAAAEDASLAAGPRLQSGQQSEQPPLARVTVKAATVHQPPRKSASAPRKAATAKRSATKKTETKKAKATKKTVGEKTAGAKKRTAAKGAVRSGKKSTRKS